MERQQAKSLVRHTQKERAVFYDRLLTLRAASLKTMVFDNSYWDEIVAFIHTRNPIWAKQNIDTTLTTYALDGCWVYDSKMKPIYGASSIEGGHLKHLPLPLAAQHAILLHQPYCHFFMKTQDGLLELRSASIHDSSDIAHTGPPKGFLIAGRLWDKDYVAELAGLTCAHAELLDPGSIRESVENEGNDTSRMRYLQNCLDWNGKQVARLQLLSNDTTTDLLRRSTLHIMALIAIFSLLILILLSVSLMEWVSRPLSLLSRALMIEQSEILTKLRADPAEFGTLARLMCDFFAQKRELKNAYDTLEDRVIDRTEQLAEANQKLQSAYEATIIGWSRAMDLRDHETEGHSQRVTETTLRLARRLGIPEDELVHIQRGSLLHDIGKMGVADHILRKDGPLNPEEWEQMRRHPTYAHEMLVPIAFLRPALDIPYCHHEQWSGTGYPRGLREEDIPLSARIFAVVDVWDALSSDRPYRDGWPPERVREHIHSLSGTHFDPQIVTIFLGMIDADRHSSLVEKPLLLAA